MLYGIAVFGVVFTGSNADSVVDFRVLIRVYFLRRTTKKLFPDRQGSTQNMQDRRTGERHAISLPIRLKWKDENGMEITEEGLTENVGPNGALVYLPRHLPLVGSKVNLTVTENPDDEVQVSAQVIRLERNAAHPQAALQLTDSIRVWKKKVWEVAAAIVAAEKPEGLDEW
jgi:hypothetical protein